MNLQRYNKQENLDEHPMNTGTHSKRQDFMLCLAIYGSTAVAAFAGIVWTEYAIWFWVILLSIWLYVTYRYVTQPLSYKSLRFQGHCIKILGLSCERVIDLRSISRIEFIRMYPDLEDIAVPGLCIERIDAFRLFTDDNDVIEIQDEWRNRGKLLRFFSNNLAGFDGKILHGAKQSKKEGTWVCFNRDHSSGCERT